MDKYTIFHLDDSPIAIKMLDKAFSNEIHKINCTTFREALEALKPKPDIDCFLIDQTLTGTTGIEFSRSLRMIEKYRFTPIVIITANLTNEVAFNAMHAGVNECLSKLTPTDEVEEIIKDHVIMPYSHLVLLETITVSNIIWKEGDKFVLFSPAIRECVEGESKQECRDLMEQKIRKSLQEQDPPKMKTPEIFEQIIDLKE